MSLALKKILIVEDERILAYALRMDLQELGFPEIDIVSNCEGAVSAVKTDDVDVVLMDINISGEKSGIETAGMISEFSRVPIIYLTGETDMETRTKAESVSNCRGYLAKPVVMELLEPLLNQVFTASEV